VPNCRMGARSYTRQAILASPISPTCRDAMVRFLNAQAMSLLTGSLHCRCPRLGELYGQGSHMWLPVRDVLRGA
jgi:hypothetical protein